MMPTLFSLFIVFAAMTKSALNSFKIEAKGNQLRNASRTDKYCISGTEPGNRNSLNKNKCLKNNIYCGEWREREWNPNGCKYRPVTSENARKCLGHRTLACIGDSQIRDFCIGVAYFLSDTTVQDSPAQKFDRHTATHHSNATLMWKFKSWGNHNKDGYTGFIFPKEITRKRTKWLWQVQIWELYCNDLIQHHHVQDILSNKMIRENNATVKLRPIDFALWSHGLHDWGWWNTQPYGENYHKTMVNQWKEVRHELKEENNNTVPNVWVSMNSECPHMIKEGIMIDETKIKLQAEMVEDANYYVHQALYIEKLPYFDADSVLRSPQRCDVSGDGVHVQMWVDIVRAQILFNHLCDADWNWVGSEEAFL